MIDPYRYSEEAPAETTLDGRCIVCSRPIHSAAASCPTCGVSQRKGKYKSKVAAALLAFFLGALGVHRFYLGQWWGVFYLLFCWTGIPGIVAFVEFILILATNNQSWDDRYNEGKPAFAGEGGAGVGIVVAIIAVPILIALAGIVAAIALPAYNDYTVKTELEQSMDDIALVKNRYMEFLLTHQMAPDSNIMLGVDEPYLLNSGTSIEVSDSGVLVSFVSDKSGLDGKTLFYRVKVVEGTASWDCSGGTLEARYAPLSCR